MLNNFYTSVAAKLAEGHWKAPSLAIWKFIQTKKLSEQAASVKKIALEIKEAEHIEPVLDVLVDTYLSCPPKHQIKRALASCLQSVSTAQPCVEGVMRQHVRECLQGCQPPISLPICRTVIDNCNSLLENFPLGERCLQSLLYEALVFLCGSLKRFYEESWFVVLEHSGNLGSLVGNITAPVALSEAMHNCHVTIQVWTKLVVGSAEHFLSNSGKPSDDLSSVLIKCQDMAWKILLNDKFLVDCRASCGMALPLIFKVMYKEDVVQKVVNDLFPGSEAASLNCYALGTSPESLPTWAVLGDARVPSWPTRMVCVAGGCLAMLDANHLATMVIPGKSLLCGVLGKQLVELIEKMDEINGKVLLSRALVLWTVQAVEILLLDEVADKAFLRHSLCGHGEMLTALMEYAWTHWEDVTDVIRHQSRLIFNNLLECHILATGEEPSESTFLLNLLASLLSTGWQQRGRYGPLCCLVGHLGARVILSHTPRLPHHLLAAMGDQTLAGYISELYEKLYSTHRRELSLAAGDSTINMTSWLVTWVDPVLSALCDGGKLQKTHVIEYILPKLLKHSPDSLTYMIMKLTEGDRVGPKIGALVTCLKRAKMSGLLNTVTMDQADSLCSAPHSMSRNDPHSALWYGVVSVDIIKKSLCHQNEQLRLDALGLVVENLKTTELLSALDLDLIMFFLPFNMSQEPSFRQHLAAILKKLFIRLRDGAQALRRKVKSGKDQAKKDVERYQVFVEWLVQQQFSSLYPGASFPCRTMALSTLSTFTSIMLEKGTTNHKDACEFALSNYITAPQAQTLIECLSDSFELNKVDSYKILTSLPHHKLYLQSPERLEALFRTGLALASSTRPQDSSTAAYLLRVLLTQPHLDQVAARVGGIPDNYPCTTINGITTGDMSVSGRHLVVVEVLVRQLKEQLEVAHQSLIHAAATKPLYPTLHCIRYMLNDMDLRSQSTSPRWRFLIKSVIDISFQVALVVSPVVSNSSPEGNVPLGPGLELNAVAQTPEDVAALHGTTDSMRTVSLIPEYLVVCCWRSIKECSLLLGQLTLTAPLTDPHGDPSTGLLSVSQLHELGDYFTTQLLESRHRGAFELAYAGFVKMTEMLWKCPYAEVQALPRQWLEEILLDIKSRELTNRLCATRRSAGVPFYVQAIVSAEPATTGRVCFRHLMTELLALAMPTATVHPTTEDPAQVHALNVLRALYRDTRLGDDVFPHVTGGLKAAILGYGSQLWGIRNSATLLFSALMTRIFGVKHSKDEISKKNCLTGRVFFHRFPALYQFLLDQMAAGTTNIGSVGVSELHPGLYPVLMVLARLYPSVVEGTNTTLNTAAFVPHVIRCASSPVYKTRLMAARAIHPLVGKDAITVTLTSLLECLPKAPEGATSQNTLHGVLLQVTALAHTVGELQDTQAAGLLHALTHALASRLWVLTERNPCLVTRKAFAELCFTALALEDSFGEGSSRTLTLRAAIRKQALSQLFSTAPPPTATPELAEYHQSLTRHLLAHVAAQDQMAETMSSGDTSGKTTVGRTCETMPTSRTCETTAKGSAYGAMPGGSTCEKTPGGSTCKTTAGGRNCEIMRGVENCEMKPEGSIYKTTPGGSTGESTEITPGSSTLECEIEETLDGSTIDLVHLVVKLLRSTEYEVRLEGLAFLGDTFYKDDGNSEVLIDSKVQCKNRTKFHTAKRLSGSECVYRQLVTMVLSENHTECLIKTLELLCHHPMIHTLPWMDATRTTHGPLTIMARLKEHKSHSSDDVRCCAHELSACLLPHLYTQAEQGSTEARVVLLRWCAELERRCSSQESVFCRQTTASSLLQGGRALLEDPRDVLGPVVYDVWTAVVRLLQDEDVDVRQVAATIVHDVTLKSDVELADRECFAPQPLVALQWAVARLVSLRADRDWRGLFECLLSWVIHDVEPEWDGQEEKAVRLFDKGEMNTYRDEMVFVTLVAEQLKNFLRHSVIDRHSPDSLTNGHDEDQDVTALYGAPNAKAVVVKLRLALVKARLEELLEDLNAKVLGMDVITGSSPFLMTSQYQEDIVRLCRLKMASSCLMGVAMEKDESERLLEKLRSDLNEKFNPVDAQTNVLLTVMGQRM